jgi:hypothetical protein
MVKVRPWAHFGNGRNLTRTVGELLADIVCATTAPDEGGNGLGPNTLSHWAESSSQDWVHNGSALAFVSH